MRRIRHQWRWYHPWQPWKWYARGYGVEAVSRSSEKLFFSSLPKMDAQNGSREKIEHVKGDLLFTTSIFILNV